MERDIQERVEAVRERMALACRRSGRAPEAVRLVGVVKGQTPDRIRMLVEAGVHDLGENRVQEGELHMAALQGLPVHWHFIGQIQKNKINRILGQYGLIHSVDSLRTLEHLDKRVEGVRELMLEINVGGEESKSGMSPEALLRAMDLIEGLHHVRVVGLMCIPPPAQDDPEESRPFFARMRALAEEIGARGGKTCIRELSMGMSDDFEVAIEEGATLIRLGTVLMGGRRL